MAYIVSSTYTAHYNRAQSLRHVPAGVAPPPDDAIQSEKYSRAGKSVVHRTHFRALQPSSPSRMPSGRPPLDPAVNDDVAHSAAVDEPSSPPPVDGLGEPPTPTPGQPATSLNSAEPPAAAVPILGAALDFGSPSQEGGPLPSLPPRLKMAGTLDWKQHASEVAYAQAAAASQQQQMPARASAVTAVRVVGNEPVGVRPAGVRQKASEGWMGLVSAPGDCNKGGQGV
jgi:hypothetical protein